MNPRNRMRAFVTLALFVLPGILSAQSITTQPLAENVLCRGGEVTVNYTLTGAVNPGNAFILQISNADGQFQGSFLNIASISSTASGSITGVIPSSLPTGSTYRFRVIASSPEVIGSDNGEDATLRDAPNIGYALDGLPFVDQPITVINASGTVKSWWNFGIGVGATPEQTGAYAPTVTYSQPGDKRIIYNAYHMVDGECSQSQKERMLTIYPVNPVLPANVTIVQNTVAYDRGNPAPDYVWICPGGNVTVEFQDPIRTVFYVETGANLTFHPYQYGKILIYAKSGASVTLGQLEGGETYLVHEPGTGITRDKFDEHLVTKRSLKVSDLVFDYSNVPPNGCPSLAPYTVQLKPDVRNIHDAESDSRSDAEYWVDGGASLNSAGDGNTYYVEAGGSVTVNGNGSRIYLKNGATLSVESGSDHRIFYETEAVITGEGENPILLPSSGITFTRLVSGVDEAEAVTGSSFVTTRPNPVVDEVEIGLKAEAGQIELVELYDAGGRKAATLNGSGPRAVLNLENYPAGVYHVRVTATSGAVFTERIVKE